MDFLESASALRILLIAWMKGYVWHGLAKKVYSALGINFSGSGSWRNVIKKLVQQGVLIEGSPSGDVMSDLFYNTQVTTVYYISEKYKEVLSRAIVEDEFVSRHAADISTALKELYTPAPVQEQYVDTPENVESLPVYNKIVEFVQQPKQLKHIHQFVLTSSDDLHSIVFDLDEIDYFDRELAQTIEKNPIEMVELFKQAVQSEIMKVNVGQKPIKFNVRFVSQNSTLIRELNENHLNHLVCLDGTVSFTGPMLMHVERAAFRCLSCGKIMYVDQDSTGELIKPVVCACGRKQFELDMSRSEFVRYQKIMLQEPFDEIEGGEGKTIDVFLFDDLVNTVKIGDRVKITGILRLYPRKSKGILPIYLEANSILKEDTAFSIDAMSEGEIKAIKKIAKRDDVLEYLSRSIAPHIKGYEKEKLAILLQMVGSPPIPDQRRDKIHILLIGDPGVGKSDLIKYVTKVMPRSMFLSGTHVSGVGLTVSAAKDPISGNWTYRAGALVLANDSIVAIDEFDKIPKEELRALNTAMEQMEVTNAKAGGAATFKTDTAILASANPRGEVYDPNIPPIDQFDIPETMLSRFDLIFAIKDIRDSKRDYELAQEVLAGNQEKVLTPKELRNYIIYVRAKYNPKLSDEVKELLAKSYADIRSRGRNVTMRQLFTLWRLTLAVARARMKKKATAEDLQVAYDLLKYSAQTLSPGDHREVDFSVMNLGVSSDFIEKQKATLEIIRVLSEQYDEITIDQIKELLEINITDKELQIIINHLKRDGMIFETPEGGIKKVRR